MEVTSTDPIEIGDQVCYAKNHIRGLDYAGETRKSNNEGHGTRKGEHAAEIRADAGADCRMITKLVRNSEERMMKQLKKHDESISRISSPVKYLCLRIDDLRSENASLQDLVVSGDKGKRRMAKKKSERQKIIEEHLRLSPFIFTYDLFSAVLTRCIMERWGNLMK